MPKKEYQYGDCAPYLFIANQFKVDYATVLIAADGFALAHTGVHFKWQHAEAIGKLPGEVIDAIHAQNAAWRRERREE